MTSAEAIQELLASPELPTAGEVESSVVAGFKPPIFAVFDDGLKEFLR